MAKPPSMPGTMPATNSLTIELPGHHAVEDHRDRRRDDDGEARRGRGDRRGESARIAAPHHRRHDHRAGRGHVGDRRAGDLGEEHRLHDVHMRQPAADEADQRHAEIHQPARDRRRVHDRAGEDEHRDGEQRKALRALVHGQRHVGQHVGALRQQDRRRGDDAERDGDRHVDEDEDDQRDEHQEDGHVRVPFVNVHLLLDLGDVGRDAFAQPPPVLRQAQRLADDEQHRADRDDRLGELDRARRAG